MEALALSHSFVAYESPESELQLELKIPTSAVIGVAGLAVALSVLSVSGEAQAGGCYYKKHCRSSHRHHSYAEVATNGGRLNIRHRASRCSHVIGKLYNGDNVKLTGRYRHGWAQLKGGGWVSTAWLD